MGGLGPGIGGAEYLVIAVVALLVVGPERLPLLLRKLGKMVAKARGMASEFRASFDEMARQSELDDLRKEVEALRQGQGMHALGADADAAFKDIRDDLSQPLSSGDASAPLLTGPEEWPDAEPVMQPLPVEAETVAPKPRKPRKAPSAAAKTEAPAKAVRKPAARKPAAKKPAARKSTT
jgi:sec-independent protein translocase protein TatB